MLRHIGHAWLVLQTGKRNATRIRHFPDKAQQKRGLASPVGANNHRAATGWGGGADVVKNEVAPPAEAYVLKADRGGKHGVICQNISLTSRSFWT